MLQSFQELDDSSGESSDLQMEGSSSLRVLDDSFASPQAEDRPLVFFDLKIDNESGCSSGYSQLFLA